MIHREYHYHCTWKFSLKGKYILKIIYIYIYIYKEREREREREREMADRVERCSKCNGYRRRLWI